MITFQAHRSNSLLSWMIRVLSVGRYSHISIRVGEYIYEAHIKKGVIKTHYKKWDRRSVVNKKRIEVTDKELKRVKNWLEKQVGKRYDIVGIFSFIFAFLPPRKGYWYCSELAVVVLAKYLGKSGQIEGQKISPGLFWQIANLVL